ncbi:MAG: D-alanyl-D-alanine carboxypeptidase [Gammaproteobacteria bacterium]|nr:MAG: D-alanyl-D-alanine carboxypeptidase [Gammaproteobacteria bacterium]
MLKISRDLALLAATALLHSTAYAATPLPSPPEVSAEAYLVADFNSGTTLAEKDPDRQVEPASITKVMTSYVVFKELEAGNLTLADQVTISEYAWRESMRTSRTFLEPRTQVSVEDLLKGMIIQSGNDASIALAEHIAGSEETFAAMMNAYAGKLGMTGTNYTNSTGLPNPEHYTTARDLVLLARALIAEFPEYYRWYADPEFTYNGITQPNRNRLLRQAEGVDGIKTGWTESAGYCLLSSGVRDDVRLIAVVLDAPKEPARNAASKALLNYGFRFFETHRLYGAGEEITSVRVWQGATETLALGVKEDVFVTVPRGRYEELSATLDLPERTIAPVDGDIPVGELTITLDEETIVTRPLYPTTSVAEGNLWQRVSDGVLLWFE